MTKEDLVDEILLIHNFVEASNELLNRGFCPNKLHSIEGFGESKILWAIEYALELLIERIKFEEQKGDNV